MRKIGEHAEPVHFVDDFFAEFGEAVMERFVGGGIGPVDVFGVGQGHVARAELVGHA